MHSAVRHDSAGCIEITVVGRKSAPVLVRSNLVYNQFCLQLLEENVLGTPVHTLVYMGSTKRTTIRLTDERQRLLDRAKGIVAADQYDDPPNSVVIDAALTHLIESQANLEEARSDLDPTIIQQFNTSVLGLRYQTSIESRWR